MFQRDCVRQWPTQGKYNQFCSEWGIQHTTISPRHSQLNGFIEHQITYLKPIVKKCLKSGSDLDIALTNVRATPLDAMLPSPVELMFNQPISTMLPSHCNQLAPEEYSDHVNKLRDQQKAYGDQHLDKEKVWFSGKVVSRNSDRSYQIQTEGGHFIHRNRQHLREMTPLATKPTAAVQVPAEPSFPRHAETNPPQLSRETPTAPVLESRTPSKRNTHVTTYDNQGTTRD